MSRVLSRLLGSSSFPTLLGGSGLALLIFNSALYNVEAGHRAVVFDKLMGVSEKAKGEGSHFRIPFIQEIKIFEVRTSPRTISTITGTKDLQTVNLSLRVLTRPSLDKLPLIFKQLGLDYAERVLPSICNEVLKAVVAQYDAAELLTLRDQVSLKIRQQLTSRAKEFHIELDDVSITHLNFSKDFSKAIEDKQVAEQMAERAKFIVAKAEQERQALIIRSEGDSEAARVVSEALAKYGKALIELRRIETGITIAETLSKNPNISYIPSQNNNNILLGINSGQR